MTLLPWIQYTDRMTGKGHPILTDTLNAALRGALQGSGYNPDASPFPGLYGPIFNARAYGALGDGVTDETIAFQACLTASIAAGGTMFIPPGQFRCKQITDTSGTRLQVVSCPGALILPTEATWLKILPGAQAKFGVTLRDLRFSVTSSTTMKPIIWLEGSNLGGIVDLDISNLDFGDLSGQTCDLLWLRACFNGRVAKLWGNGMQQCRGILYGAKDFNSGNIHFDTLVFANAGIGMQLNQAWSGANPTLLNTVTITNLKVANSSGTDTNAYNPVTLTAGASANDTTLTVSSGDASAVATALSAGTPQWAICASATSSGDAVRVLSAAGTTITLADLIPQALANGTIIPIGSFGAVLLGNSKDVTFINPHFERVGFGICGSNAQVCRVIGGRAPGDSTTQPTRFMYLTNGTQDCIALHLAFSLAGTQQTLMEVTNQGTNARNELVHPVGYSAGAGPANFLLNSASVANANRFIRAAFGTTKGIATYGTTVTPDESHTNNRVQVTDGVAFTVAVPINRYDGCVWSLDIWNNSGGAMGAVTFAGNYKLAGAFVAPAVNTHRMILFRDNGGNIHEIARTAADVFD